MIETVAIKEYLWESVSESFSTMIMIDLERLEDEDIAQYDGLLLAGTITFTGDVEGSLTILSSMGCAKKISRSMLMMEDDDPVNQSEVNDAMGEVANLSLGCLKTRLLNDGREILVSIPTVTKGRKMRPIMGSGSQRETLFVKAKGYMVEFTLTYK